MQTLKEYHYTYYSYEEWGKGYIGSRTCKCPPEEDIKYFGSYKDKTFRPTQKIILKSDYATREEAYIDEIILQHYYNVVENLHFANKAYQTSTKFFYIDGSVGGKKAKELGLGVHSLSREQLSENGKRGGKIGGIKGGKISGKENRELGRGIFAFTSEQRSETAKKAGKIQSKQKWKCSITGYVTTSGPLTQYQKKRNIDPSNRIKISC
jgi:hypothetical protein